MPKSQNKLTRFWQELKRRKVFGVVTTYAATAYIIIEATNNLVGPLNLPAWIAKLVILLLGAGLPVAVILSWIFDFTPQGIKKTESLEESENKEIIAKPVKRKLRASYILNAVLIIAVIVLAYREIFKRDTLDRLRSSGERISVAVMPFQNMTNDTTWNVMQNGFQEDLVTYLSNFSDELKVRHTESVYTLIQSKNLASYASLTPSVAKTISQKLDANVFIDGSIQQEGTNFRVNAQIIDTKTEEVLKSFEITEPYNKEMIFRISDSLRKKVTDFLRLSKLIKHEPVDLKPLTPVSSPEAYSDFIKGQNAYAKYDYANAKYWWSQAIAIDSDWIMPNLGLMTAYSSLGLNDSAKKWCLKLYKKRELMPPRARIYINVIHAGYFETPNDAIKYLRQDLEFDDQFPLSYWNIGANYDGLQQYDKAIPEYEKALEIYKKWNTKPTIAPVYTNLGFVYHKTGQYKKEKRLYRKAEQDFPGDPNVIFRQAVLALSEGDTAKANRYIKKFTLDRKENSVSQANIATYIAGIYLQADIMDKAEEYYRKALTLEPENAVRMINLSYFLIDKDRNINEGLELADKVLELRPDSYWGLECKGWGLYKQGIYKGALEILQKSWDLRIEKSGYNHEAYLQVEAAKKAVAGLK